MKFSIRGQSLVFVIAIFCFNYCECFHKREERLARKQKLRLERKQKSKLQRLELKAKKHKELEQQLNQTVGKLEEKLVLKEKSLEKYLKDSELSLSMQGDQGTPGLPGIRGPSGPDGRPVSHHNYKDKSYLQSYCKL